MQRVRTPAVAGLFYPDDPIELHNQVQQFLQQVKLSPEPPPKALIAPHAGYIYSGPIAASVYARLHAVRTLITRVVLLGPSHRLGFRGIATSQMAAFQTPLGSIPIDQETVQSIQILPDVGFLEQAHVQEHSLEVHLPFLQEVLADFKLVPLVVGDARPPQVGAVLEALWGDPETLIVISSDLSHYQDYAAAQRLDHQTSHAIETLQFDAIGYEQACGRNPVNGLLWVAQRKHLHGKTIDLRNSGDTAGSRDRVVGYGAYVFH
jgi:AmmeMemoRadiSam system protein B